ncbi:FecCD family ABC transporter permease [Ruania alba]|uniref:Iron complex transport system permease protein n=1 Tax=Ruania alba TaxID=648782 RepID=A0A1H5MBD3_9MICO|nr:iron ABC transporter permease [Ruania alba]SEE86463.1 iron complex transport system permease protein [Ruania alba]
MTATTQVRPARRRSHVRMLVLIVLIAVLGTLATVSLTIGSSDIPPLQALLAALGVGESGDVFAVQVLRLPRVLVAIAAGGCLGASGALLQGLMRNPLASPDIVGVTGGATLATVLTIGAGVSPSLLPVSAGIGALGATALLAALSRHTGTSTVRLVLVGIGLHAIVSAAVTLVIARIPADRLGAAEVWMAGSLHARSTTHVVIVLLGAALTLPLAYLLLRRLGALELGDEMSVAMGVPTRTTRTLLLVVAALLAGVAVAVAGPIGFVALGAPHIARRLVGPTSAAMLTTSAGVGGLLLVAADLIGRTILGTTAIPAGIITAALGAPYLLWLLHQTGRR